jgi:hypothetical protein
MTSPTVEVELLGVARYVARTAVLRVPLAEPATAAAVLRALRDACPALVGVAVDASATPLGGHVLARTGGTLLRSGEEPVSPGERLMLLSVLAGGAC